MKSQEEERLIIQAMEQSDKFHELRSELVDCDINRKSLERELYELKSSENN